MPRHSRTAPGSSQRISSSPSSEGLPLIPPVLRSRPGEIPDRTAVSLPPPEERLSRPTCSADRGQRQETPAQDSAQDAGVSLPRTSSVGAERPRTPEPRAAEPSGRGALRPRSPQPAPPPRGARSRAWHAHQHRRSAPAPPLGARARHPISVSGVPEVPPLHPARPISTLQGECSYIRPLPCGSYKRDALETPESVGDWRRLSPIALRSGGAGAL